MDEMGACMGELIASKRGFPTLYIWDRSAVLEFSRRPRLENNLNFMLRFDEGCRGLWEV
jgi:hypothetical protein